MTDQVTQEAEAAAAAEAGYNRRAGVATPAPSPEPVKPEPPLADAAPSETPAAQAPAVPDDAPNLEAEPDKTAPAQHAISAQLEDVKSQIRELRANGVDAQTVHRLFGEIGGITRTLKQLQSKNAPPDQLAGAIKKAEAMAEEYPAIGEPVVEALKAMLAQLPKQPEPEPDPAPTPPPAPATPPASPFTEKQLALIEALESLHPDRLALNANPEFNTWLAAKGRDYEKTFRNSWDFKVIAQGYTDFKAAQATKQRRKETLEASQTPKGVSGSQSNVLPDEAGALIGYNSRKRRP